MFVQSAQFITLIHSSPLNVIKYFHEEVKCILWANKVKIQRSVCYIKNRENVVEEIESLLNT